MARIILLLIIHMIGDFFLQGTKLSRRKWLQLPSLFEHAGIYTVTLFILSPLLLGLTMVDSILFTLLNGVLHFAVDYFVGKLKLKYWDVDEDKYFKSVGVDQALHVVILVSTYVYLFPDAINAPSIFGNYF